MHRLAMDSRSTDTLDAEVSDVAYFPATVTAAAAPCVEIVDGCSQKLT